MSGAVRTSWSTASSEITEKGDGFEKTWWSANAGGRGGGGGARGATPKFTPHARCALRGRAHALR